MRLLSNRSTFRRGIDFFVFINFLRRLYEKYNNLLLYCSRRDFTLIIIKILAEFEIYNKKKILLFFFYPASESTKQYNMAYIYIYRQYIIYNN